jgi:hypothetical protein
MLSNGRSLTSLARAGSGVQNIREDNNTSRRTAIRNAIANPPSGKKVMLLENSGALLFAKARE